MVATFAHNEGSPMGLTVKLALGNVSRSVRDYSVYFATLTFAACLLYSFTASGDYLLKLGLTPAQQATVVKAAGVTQAFSIFVVLVFAVLVAYASRFIVRRRSREFGLYALLGMRVSRVAAVLAAEGIVVAAFALVTGLVLGVAVSPAFGVVAAFVFDVPWHLAWSFSPEAAAWCAQCFLVIQAVAVALSVRDVCATPVAVLTRRNSAPEHLRLSGPVATALQAALAAALLAVVWGVCVLAPGMFVLLVIPLGCAAYAATSLVFRCVASWLPERLRRQPRSYFSGVRMLAARQVEARLASGCSALSCVSVLIACAVCMVCAGLAFSVGVRLSGNAELAAGLAPIGYVGIFYGESFLVAAAAVLALQQLSQAIDATGSYRTLAQLGADRAMARSAVRSQVAVSFVAPATMAVVHDAFGLTLVASLATGWGSAAYLPMAALTVTGTLALLALYYALTVHECERVLLADAFPA